MRGVIVVTYDRGETKPTPSPTDLDCTVRLYWSLTIERILWGKNLSINIVMDSHSDNFRSLLTYRFIYSHII